MNINKLKTIVRVGLQKVMANVFIFRATDLHWVVTIGSTLSVS